MEHSKLDLINQMIEQEDDKGEVSDGHHSFNDLYEHRDTLFCALIVAVEHEHDLATCFWSKQHSDGSMFPGYIIAGILTPSGYVTYLMKEKFIEHLPAEIRVPFAPEWDGHTSQDSLERLSTYFKPVTSY